MDDRQPTMDTIKEAPTAHTAQSRTTAHAHPTYASITRQPTHAKMSRQPTQNTLATNGLAGPPAYPKNRDVFFEDGYEDENPWMQQQDDDGPGFSLAGNFPRTVRWRRKRPGVNRHDTVKPDQQGETEPAPQLEVADDLREGNDHDPVEEAGSIGEEESIKRRRREQHQRDGELPPPQPMSHETPPSYPPDIQPFNGWANIRMKFQRPLAEFLGMSVFIFLGINANLSVYVSQSQSGNQNTVWWVWGLADMIGIYIAGGTSGGFLNPMLVVMLSIFRGFPARRIPTYLLAQLLGAFIGALLAFAMHYDSIMHLDGALIPETTGVNFYTQPQADYISVGTAFCVEMLGSAVIACSILALGDSGNSPPGAGMHALIIGLMITTTCMAMGWTTRGCFNPARDLGPRLAALAVGYPLHSFTDFQNFWIWGAWVAPMVGGIIGGLAYDGCIFKGGESPVNYSGTLWKRKGLQKESEFFDYVMRNPRKADDVANRLESGELDTPEDKVKAESEAATSQSQSARPSTDQAREPPSTSYLDNRFQRPE